MCKPKTTMVGTKDSMWCLDSEEIKPWEKPGNISGQFVVHRHNFGGGMSGAPLFESTWKKDLACRRLIMQRKMLASNVWQHFLQVLPIHWVKGAAVSRTTTSGVAGTRGSDLWPHVPSGFVYDNVSWEAALPHQRDPRAAAGKNSYSRYVFSEV